MAFSSTMKRIWPVPLFVVTKACFEWPLCIEKPRQYFANRPSNRLHVVDHTKGLGMSCSRSGAAWVRSSLSKKHDWLMQANDNPNNLNNPSVPMASCLQELLSHSSGVDVLVDVFDDMDRLLCEALVANQATHVHLVVLDVNSNVDLVAQATRQLCLYNIDEVDTIYNCKKVVIVVNNPRVCNLSRLEVLTDKALNSSNLQVIVKTNDAWFANSMRIKFPQLRMAYDASGTSMQDQSSLAQLRNLNNTTHLLKLMQECPSPKCMLSVYKALDDLETCEAVVKYYQARWRRMIHVMES